MFRHFHDRSHSPDEAARAVAGLYRYFGDYRRGLEWAERIQREHLRELTRMFFLIVLGRNPEAVQAGEKAIEEYPDDAMAYAELGLACGGDKGYEHWKKALRLDPGNVSAHIFIAALRLRGRGKLGAAKVHLEKALERGDSPDIQRSLALVCLLMGKKDEASAHVERGLELIAKGVGLYRKRDALGFNWGFGQLLELQKRPREALGQYTRVLSSRISRSTLASWRLASWRSPSRVAARRLNSR